MFCNSLNDRLSFLFWPLYCLSLFDTSFGWLDERLLFSANAVIYILLSHWGLKTFLETNETIKMLVSIWKKSTLWKESFNSDHIYINKTNNLTELPKHDIWRWKSRSGTNMWQGWTGQWDLNPPLLITGSPTAINI